MRLGNYLCLLMGIVMTRAQDDNPSGHELQDHNHMFDDSLTTTTGTSSLDDSLTTTTGTSSLDSSLSTSTSVNTFNDNAFRVSIGNKNVIEYKILLCGLLLL